MDSLKISINSIIRWLYQSELIDQDKRFRLIKWLTNSTTNIVYMKEVYSIFISLIEKLPCRERVNVTRFYGQLIRHQTLLPISTIEDIVIWLSKDFETLIQELQIPDGNMVSQVEEQFHELLDAYNNLKKMYNETAEKYNQLNQSYTQLYTEHDTLKTSVRKCRIKSKFCIHWLKRKCDREICAFAHGIYDLNSSYSLCRIFNCSNYQCVDVHYNSTTGCIENAGVIRRMFDDGHLPSLDPAVPKFIL